MVFHQSWTVSEAVDGAALYEEEEEEQYETEEESAKISYTLSYVEDNKKERYESNFHQISICFVFFLPFF